MIRAVIVEDERLSADRLKSLIERLNPSMEVVAVLDSVGSAREWFQDQKAPDLLFLDIQLNDGISFDLLLEGAIHCPIIFTTAYDQFAIKAFKFNSIDYLLKPVELEALRQALAKFERSAKSVNVDAPTVTRLERIVSDDFKKRFLVKLGEKFQSVDIGEVAYFFYQEGITYLQTRSGKKWPIDQTLEVLEEVLNPIEFFRVSRKLIISLPAVSEIHTYFNSRLLLKLTPQANFETIVSRERVADFKRWMDL